MSQDIVFKQTTTHNTKIEVTKKASLWAFLKNNRQFTWLIGSIFPLFLLLLWHVAVEKSWVNPLLLPAPDLVWTALKDLYESGELWANLSISLTRIAYGFSAGMLLALILGLSMGLSRTVEAYVWPTFKVINLVPVVGWIPLLILLVGIDEALKIILIAKAALVPMTINIFKGVRNIPESLTEVVDVYQLSTWSRFKNLVLPGAFMSFIGGLRLSLASAWGALVAVELLASSEGIGYLMVYGRQIFQLDVVMATVIVIGFVGFFFDVLIRLLQKKLSPWNS
ncbi:ABC transporter permease [Acinetobacter sichuanensis]|uniref:ABC transporter permease n=1 Tax=Acinetobacter sichuanensis TaxID=2136183 RepID=A0A371YKX9_9GAMM|nr:MULTISPECIES: ABC transporter permease [Acinetobacter]MDM1248928.1 ABC transporter permease [Acinetobacter sp. R933-2]MDM1765875.1 ABC transporter permease [Acinetobacter sp. 226-1]MDM1769613.1 ABC transporter permease [Acinetobacter sp. 226-4]RFC81984.1 ABC transporter permease [Acinetobacter sichuanensis]